MLSFMRIQKNKIEFFSQSKIKRNLTHKKRAFPLFSLRYKGSMTVEACLVLPLFLFFLMTVLMGIEITRMQSQVWYALCTSESDCFRESCIDQMNDRLEATKMNITTLAQNELYARKDSLFCLRDIVKLTDCSDLEGTGKIELQADYEIKPFIYWLPISNTSYGVMCFQDVLTAHAFCGYKGSLDGSSWKEQTTYVFVTKTGSRYHQNKECISLRITPLSVDRSELGQRRNQQGGKYYPCEKCHPTGRGMVFLTQDGNRYHKDVNCSALKRTVYMVSLEDAVRDGKTSCGRCY